MRRRRPRDQVVIESLCPPPPGWGVAPITPNKGEESPWTGVRVG